MVNALAVLGIDKGNKIKREAPAPHKTSPKPFYPNHDLIYSSVEYKSIIIGKAVFI
jgi:hypothetical protein